MNTGRLMLTFLLPNATVPINVAAPGLSGIGLPVVKYRKTLPGAHAYEAIVPESSVFSVPFTFCINAKLVVHVPLNLKTCDEIV